MARGKRPQPKPKKRCRLVSDGVRWNPQASGLPRYQAPLSYARLMAGMACPARMVGLTPAQAVLIERRFEEPSPKLRKALSSDGQEIIYVISES